MLKSTNGSGKKSRKIYLDYASSSLPDEANPSAIHALGVGEKRKLEEARKKVAAVLNAQREEIIFTGGATESNNLAILGLVKGFKKPHIVTSNIEHASVLEVCRYLEGAKQAEVTYVHVERNGIINPQKVRKALRPDTVLVSIMYANNEIGTIQPIREIAKEIRHYNKINSRKIFFHTDAVQAANYLPIKIPELGVDMMSLNGAKIYGPKGVGILYIKKVVPLHPIMYGGGQEFGLRSGTENPNLAQGFANALWEAQEMRSKEAERLLKLQKYFFAELKKNSPVSFVINGDQENRLPNNINITFPNIPSDLLVIELSAKGVMVSAKSACKSALSQSSHVIEALRRGEKGKNGDASLRFSLGRGSTKKDVDYCVKALSFILTKLKKWYS